MSSAPGGEGLAGLRLLEKEKKGKQMRVFFKPVTTTLIAFGIAALSLASKAENSSAPQSAESATSPSESSSDKVGVGYTVIRKSGGAILSVKVKLFKPAELKGKSVEVAADKFDKYAQIEDGKQVFVKFTEVDGKFVTTSDPSRKPIK